MSMRDTIKEKQKAIKIAKAVSEHYDMSLLQVFHKTRKRQITIKRQLVFYLCRKHTILSFGGISAVFENYMQGKVYDHATVIHSCRVIQNIMDTDKNFRKEVEFLELEVQKVVIIFNKSPLTPQKKELLELRIKIIKSCRTSMDTLTLKNELKLVL
tara:strand:- start:315 stop:782 length:468 start_codon:yes stop_codon:yes gene_type:complete